MSNVQVVFLRFRLVWLVNFLGHALHLDFLIFKEQNYCKVINFIISKVLLTVSHLQNILLFLLLLLSLFCLFIVLLTIRFFQKIFFDSIHFKSSDFCWKQLLFLLSILEIFQHTFLIFFFIFSTDWSRNSKFPLPMTIGLSVLPSCSPSPVPFFSVIFSITGTSIFPFSHWKIGFSHRWYPEISKVANYFINAVEKFRLPTPSFGITTEWKYFVTFSFLTFSTKEVNQHQQKTVVLRNVTFAVVIIFLNFNTIISFNFFLNQCFFLLSCTFSVLNS